MKVSQEPLAITDIIKNKSFSVPIYQREYAWNLEQVSDLFYDIDQSSDEGHFLGSLLLYQNDETGKMEIVDGQQRMTTIFILLFTILEEIELTTNQKAINRVKSLLFEIDPNDLSEDNSSTKPRLQTGKRDKKLFKAIILNEDYEIFKDGRRKSHKNLTNSLVFFRDRLQEKKDNYGTQGIIDFTSKVIKCTFVVMTAEKRSDKLLLFKTVNARGLDLTQGDLIKNELCHSLESAEIDEYIESWDDMRGRIEKNNGKLDKYLFHYINSINYIQEERRRLDKRRGVTKWDKDNYPPVPEKYVFDIYCQVIEREGAQAFITNILKSSEDYIEMINPSNDHITFMSLKAMGVNKCFPLFLNIKRKISTESFNRITTKIDALTFRHSILRNDPKELERFYYRLAEIIKTDTDCESVLKTISEHSNFKEEEKFKLEFIVASPKQSISRMILDRICRKLSESIDWSNKDAHIEHIMPKKPGGEWSSMFDKDSDQYKDYLNRLGNLTILQDKKNIRAKNHNFAVKQQQYAESRLKITNMLVDYSVWGYDQIDKRQEELYELGKEVWQ